MKRPEYVDVGAKRYTIHWSKKAWKARVPGESKKERDSDEAVGRTDHFTSQIWIDPSMGEQEKRSTLVHELLHCLWWSTGVTMTVLWRDDDDDTEEAMVSVLEPRLTELVVRNPHVFDYLAGERLGEVTYSISPIDRMLL